MTGLPAFFTLTSEKPYDRHKYKIFCTDGSVKIVDDYMRVMEAWWNYPQYCDHVDVIDKPKNVGKGFA
jgi:hypothetical protein